MRSLLALPTLRARIWIGLLRSSKPITASRLEGHGGHGAPGVVV